MLQAQAKAAVVILQAFLQAFRELVISSWQIEEAVQVLTQMIVKAGDNDPFEIFLDLLRGVFSHCPHQAVNKQYRLNHLNVEYAMGP